MFLTYSFSFALALWTHFTWHKTQAHCVSIWRFPYKIGIIVYKLIADTNNIPYKLSSETDSDVCVGDFWFGWLLTEGDIDVLSPGLGLLGALSVSSGLLNSVHKTNEYLLLLFFNCLFLVTFITEHSIFYCSSCRDKKL